MRMNKNGIKRLLAAILLTLLLCGCKSQQNATIPKPTHIPEQHKEAHRKLLREQHQLIMRQTNKTAPEDTESWLPT